MVRRRHHHTHYTRFDHQRGLLAAIAGLAAVAVTAARVGVGRRVVVVGESMSPAFDAGDRLLIVPVWRPRPGQVVALTDPRRPERQLVKRVYRVDGKRVEVRGDNRTASTDSRHFGPVPRRALRGRAIYRYAPPSRVGWLSDQRPY
jgi:signal peptidase I